LAALVGAALALGLAGCGSGELLLSHGKPVDHWLQEMKNPDVKARKKAVVALGHVGTADERALPALIDALKDKDAPVRSEAVLALMNLGPQARDAIPALQEAERDRDASVRALAAKALARIQGAG
jgi:HEAT repeat protein